MISRGLCGKIILVITMKLLSPAGNLQALKVAVYNGADEIYLGVNDFNARNNIDGFTTQSIKEGVDFAHLYGVKVLLAINVLFTDQEMQNAVDVAVECANAGVDAFIVQDLGFAKLLREYYPNLQLHASTQAGVHNLEGAKFFESLGFKRIVLARETPLDEIKRIKDNCNIEIEYFVQGALCVGFSGNCYLSSYLCSASGNRGRCKQLCRLPYTLKFKDKSIKKGYLLSAKDFNLLSRLKQLEQAGVDAVKIEGRARRPYYVAVCTREYRRALDGLKANQENLELAFNRNYTQGYFDGNGEIVSVFNNHIGIKIGQVLNVNNGKKFNEVIFSSNRELSPKSTFKFFDGDIEKNTLTAFDLKAVGKDKYKLTTTQSVSNGLVVRLIVDDADEKKALSLSTLKKVKLNISANENTPIRAEFFVDGFKHEVLGEVCQKAKSSPITQQQVLECFSKSQYFEPDIELSLGKVFLPKSQLNEFRRKVYESLFFAITSPYHKNLSPVKINLPKRVAPLCDFEFTDKVNGSYKANIVIFSPEKYERQDLLMFIENCKNQNKQAFLQLPNYATYKDVQFIKQLIKDLDVGIVANNYYAINLAKNTVIGGGLNVYNGYTAEFFNLPYITAENSVNGSLVTEFAYMTLLHCPIKSHVGGNCKNCNYKDGYYYLTESGKRLNLTRKKLSSCTFYLNK